MSRAPLWRAVVAFVIIAASAVLAYTMPPRLGLDLRGGTQLVFEATDSPDVKADAEATDRALDVLRRRADALGVVDPTLVRSGERRIIVELPGVLDPRQAAEVIGKTAQLTFHPVPRASPSENAKDALADESGQKLKLGPAAITGDGVDRRRGAARPPAGAGQVRQRRVPRRRRLAEAHRQGRLRPGRRPQAPGRDRARQRDHLLAAGRPVRSPATAGITGGGTQITGDFTQEEAQDLAVLIKGGSLPVPLELIEQRTVGPTLGAEAIEASAKAAVAGVIAHHAVHPRDLPPRRPARPRSRSPPTA